jgi:hypothetical protein
MRKLLLLLAIATMLLVITATAAHADYWPPDMLAHVIHG